MCQEKCQEKWERIFRKSWKQEDDVGNVKYNDVLVEALICPNDSVTNFVRININYSIIDVHHPFELSELYDVFIFARSFEEFKEKLKELLEKVGAWE